MGAGHRRDRPHHRGRPAHRGVALRHHRPRRAVDPGRNHPLSPHDFRGQPARHRAPGRWTSRLSHIYQLRTRPIIEPLPDHLPWHGPAAPPLVRSDDGWDKSTIWDDTPPKTDTKPSPRPPTTARLPRRAATVLIRCMRWEVTAARHAARLCPAEHRVVPERAPPARSVISPPDGHTGRTRQDAADRNGKSGQAATVVVKRADADDEQHHRT